MKLKAPFAISSRLMAAVQIGGAWISIGYAKKHKTAGRVSYHYCIDLPDGVEHEASDISSPRASIKEAMETLLSFLGAAAESWRYKGEDGENSDLFPEAIVEWAAQHSDEIDMIALEISETDCIEE